MGDKQNYYIRQMLRNGSAKRIARCNSAMTPFYSDERANGPKIDIATLTAVDYLKHDAANRRQAVNKKIALSALNLTIREIEILNLVYYRYNRTGIRELLSLTEGQLIKAKLVIMEKLQAKTIRQAARIAKCLGVIGEVD